MMNKLFLQLLHSEKSLLHNIHITKTEMQLEGLKYIVYFHLSLVQLKHYF